jgi:ornithine decarboxylase
MNWMTELFGSRMGFDCASINEMETVRRLSADVDIVYAQPCKTTQDIQQSKQYSVQTTVVDSPEEMRKLGLAKWHGDVLIRLLVPDTNSRQPFSKKFGAPIQWVPQILTVAQQFNIPISGVSFHVGSECENPEQFARAIQVCHQAFELGKTQGAKMDLIDIGGGFLPTEINLKNVAAAIRSASGMYFPYNKTSMGAELQWIAEPGRFLSSTSQSLYTPIIGCKRGLPSTDPMAPEIRYTLNESVYGYFSNVPFDGQKPEFRIAHKNSVSNSSARAILFGRTCDGADVISSNILLPTMEEGDWLRADHMGAYTNVTASEFNGFPKPDIIYLEN